MIDIHSHILPNIDDGARDIQEALSMVQMSIDTGVNTLVLTPHIHFGRFNNSKIHIQNAFDNFKNIVEQRQLKVRLKLGAEVRIGTDLISLVSRNEIPWLGSFRGRKTFLLEFPRVDVPHGSDRLVKWLFKNDCLPIIVHPERNSTFLSHREKLKVFTDMGCPIQITSSSLTGKFGNAVKKMAMQLVVDKEVSAIASDCHNLKGRSPDLDQGFKIAADLIGQEEAKLLVTHFPSILTQHAIKNSVVVTI